MICTPLRLARPASLFVAALACLGASRSLAEDLVPPTVTAISEPGAARMTAGGQERIVELGNSLAEPGDRVTLADAQAMIVHSRSGHASLVILGPATFSASVAGGETVEIRLDSGRVQAVARMTPGQTQPVQLVVPGATDADEALLTAPLGDGVTYLNRQGDSFELGYAATSGAGEIRATLAGEDKTLKSGKRLTVRAGEAQSEALDPWRSEKGFDRPGLGTELAFASARLQRGLLADRLFVNVSEWDRLGSASAAIAKATGATKKAEIRSVSVAVASQTPANSNATANINRLSGSFATANQVPPLSPAAIAVGGVSAVTGLNSRAADLLRRTQARGLGFRGLSLLAVPGIDPITGTRTIGPPGLGARP